jgi:superfamily II DNA or RNA helicase
MKRTPRPYQVDALKAIKENFEKGVNKQLIVMATGTGKTVVFVHLLVDLIKITGKKALIIAHRKELLTQAQDKVWGEAPELKVEIEQGDSHASEDCDVVIASVQTVGRVGSARIGKWNPEDFCVVICDEAHHAPADTYRSVFKWLGCLKKGKAFKGLDDEDMDLITKYDIELPEDNTNHDWNKNILLLGVTATPNRMDNKGVNTIFDKQVYSFDIKAGVDCKALVRPKGRIIRTRTDITKVKQQQGDFKIGELSEAIDTPERNLLVVKAYLDNLKDIPFERAIVFAADVAHTKHLTETFKEQGVSADYVTGETPSEERKQKLLDFKTGKISVMVNAMVLTEGYDNEYVGGIMIARPTRSGILYLQMIGRGTRPVLLADGTPSPLKNHVLVLDFVDVTTRHDVKTISHIINIDQPIDFKGQDIFAAQDKINDLMELAPGTDLSKLDIERIDYAIQEVDLLAGLHPPREITDNTRFDWFKIMDGYYKLNLGSEKGNPISRSLYIEENQLGEWVVTDRAYNKTTRMETTMIVGDYSNFKESLKEADHYIKNTYSESLRLIDSRATWRFGDKTPTQIEYLRKARVPEVTIQKMNKGDSVRLLNKLWSQRR